MNSSHTELKQLDDKLRHEGGRILVIQTAFLGDVILMTPLIAALRKMYPKCEINLLINKAWADVISNLVEAVIPIDKNSSRNKSNGLKNLVNKLKGKNFDLAVIPHRSFRSAYMAKQAGIAHRIGFNKGGGKYLHTIRVDYPQLEYEGKRNLRLLAPLSDDQMVTKPFLKPSDDDYNVVNEIIKGRKLSDNKYIVIAPGSVWHTKRWYKNQYRSFITMLYEIHGIDSFFIGSKDDRELCDKIALNSELNFAGQLTPLQSCALIKGSIFSISGDSAPAHMATAMNHRQVIIFGSTTSRFGFVAADENIRCAGIDLWCRPCTNHGRKSCPLIRGNLRCLTEILPANIYNMVKDWLQ